MNFFAHKTHCTTFLLSCVFIFLLTAALPGCQKKEETPTPESATPTTHSDSSETTNDMAKNPKLNVGDTAPSWSLDSDNAGTISSDSLSGQKYILYFYPKDNTKGCTIEAIDFQTHAKEFAEKGYKVFGVSSDDIDSHKEFRDDHNLEFTLLSDPDHKVAESYGVYREKNSYGRTSVGTVRSTFVVDETGKITQIHDNVKATGHVERLLKEL